MPTTHTPAERLRIVLVLTAIGALAVAAIGICAVYVARSWTWLGALLTALPLLLAWMGGYRAWQAYERGEILDVPWYRAPFRPLPRGRRPTREDAHAESAGPPDPEAEARPDAAPNLSAKDRARIRQVRERRRRARAQRRPSGRSSADSSSSDTSSE